MLIPDFNFFMFLLKHNTEYKKGSIVIMVLVFASVFVTIMIGLSGFVFVQNKASVVKENREKALQVAEAGLDYYRWFLAHNPGDLQDGTGSPGPYVHSYSDPEGGDIGEFSLEVDGNLKCGSVTSIDITSTGSIESGFGISRKVFGKYSRPSVAEYAYIINTNVWAGADRIISGRYHSNGGIRMDGTNESLVTSAVEDWLCTSSFGCNPDDTKDGVFGESSNSHLWEFPVETVDFVGIVQDLVNMKTQAQNNGLYFGAVGGESNQRGYHVILRSDSTADVYKVTKTQYHWGLHIDDIGAGWQRDYHTIDKETFMGNYSIPVDCALLFFEDKVWLEGQVSGKVTIAAADVSQPNYDPSVIINDNITYTTLDGTDGITVIAENSILVPLYAPDDLEIRGVLIAQKGYFGRNLYGCWYAPYDKRNSLTMTGTIVSNERVGTRWGYTSRPSCLNEWSGFNTRINSYDRKLATDPPPLTPFVDDEYKFVEWREVE